MIDWIINTSIEAWGWLPPGWQLFIEILAKIILIVLPMMLAVAYVTYAERKIISYIQVRIGPNRVGPRGCSRSRTRSS